MDAHGQPRTFSTHGYGDGDGGDSTPFLPRTFFSTEFVTPIDWEFLAFVSNEAGTVTVGGVDLALEGSGGVFKARADSGGSTGVRIMSSVPVWAMMESIADQDEQLLYGRVNPDVATVDAGADDVDDRLYRLFVARVQTATRRSLLQLAETTRCSSTVSARAH